VKLLFRPKLFAASLLGCAAVGLALSYFGGISYWWALAIVVGGMLVNGLVAEVEDRSPGGLLHRGNEEESQ
jgi:hypothetical protein